jgi:tRNA U54 and U55 pseudouridine synthase Pus10
MWKINQNQVNQVKTILNELEGVCPRCVLRCAGVKNSGLMREAGRQVENGQDEESKAKKVKMNEEEPCRLCLGLLEERYMDSALESVSLKNKLFKMFWK